MESKEGIINQLKNIRDDDINFKISLQDQLVLIFKLFSGETTVEDHQAIIASITQIYTSCGFEIEKVEQMNTDQELENYIIPRSFLSEKTSKLP